MESAPPFQLLPQIMSLSVGIVFIMPVLTGDGIVSFGWFPLRMRDNSDCLTYAPPPTGPDARSEAAPSTTPFQTAAQVTGGAGHTVASRSRTNVEVNPFVSFLSIGYKF